MRYRTYLPPPELRPYVKCYWALTAEANPFPAAEPLIPDGCMELIINLGAPYRRSRLEGGGAFELARGSHLVGERTHPFLIEQLGPIDHVAVRFKPGGLYAFARLSMLELTNRLVDAELVFGSSHRDLEEQLFACETDDGRVALLDHLLLRRLRPTDARAELARAATRIITQRSGDLTVGELCCHLQCDYKQLERGFLAVVGVGPKFFTRLVRFMSLFESLKANPLESLADRALHFGYYDQAHFTKEFRSFIGVTPAQFVPRPASITDMLITPPEGTPVSNSYKTPSSARVRLHASAR